MYIKPETCKKKSELAQNESVFDTCALYLLNLPFSFALSSSLYYFHLMFVTLLFCTLSSKFTVKTSQNINMIVVIIILRFSCVIITVICPRLINIQCLQVYL